MVRIEIYYCENCGNECKPVKLECNEGQRVAYASDCCESDFSAIEV